MDVAGAPIFERGERYRLPSGKAIEVLKRVGDHLTCRYVRNDGRLYTPGNGACKEVMLTQRFLASFGVRE